MTNQWTIEIQKLKKEKAELLEALKELLIQAEKTYQELTDGEFGKFAEYRAAKKAKKAIAKAESN